MAKHMETVHASAMLREDSSNGRVELIYTLGEKVTPQESLGSSSESFCSLHV